jgi:dipeptidyl aminopeptidase/acylaminoacyl peptidase
LNGTPWDAPAGYFRESSIYHVKGNKTATMFVSGDPANGSERREDNEFLYVALRDQGVPAELLQYDDEGHGLSKPGDQLDLLRRATAWFDAHLMHVSTK